MQFDPLVSLLQDWVVLNFAEKRQYKHLFERVAKHHGCEGLFDEPVKREPTKKVATKKVAKSR